MTGEQFAILRRALSAAAGRHVSQTDLGRALGLAEVNSRRTVARWEEGRPSGPAAIAMTYLAQGCLDEVMRQIVPEYVEATALPDGQAGPELVIRLWWPRFVGAVLSAEVEPPGDDWAWIEPGVERLAVAMWIDDPTLFGADAEALVRRGAALFQERSLDALEGAGR